MKFEPKISGTRVEDYEIDPIFTEQHITLKQCIYVVQRQETMDWILDKFRFTKGTDGDWYAILDWDTIMKLSILEKYPEYEKEMVEYFGDSWMKQYIRFNH